MSYAVNMDDELGGLDIVRLTLACCDILRLLAAAPFTPQVLVAAE